jgi:glycosyltransferase involved in cell wall biosynthesis
MKLGVVTTSYPRWPGDPAGSFVAGHVAALRALGHRVEVIAAGAALPADHDAATRRVGGTGLFERGGAPDALERMPLRAGAEAAIVLARVTAAVWLRAARWDAIVAHWLAPSALAALPTRPPLVAIAHGGDVFTLRRLRLLHPVLAALRWRAARLVFVSEHLRAIARAAAPGLASWLDGATIQPMGIELERFARLAPAPSDPPTVLVVARLVPVKGVDVAITAMRHLATAAQLVIAGDGPDRARLTAAPGTHRLLGAVSTVQRDALLSAASVVVVPSRILPAGRTEGTPTIAIEALAAGVPVIASAVGGLRELSGVQLVRPDDPVALARAIEQTLARPPGAQALRASVAHLAWREVAPRLIRV